MRLLTTLAGAAATACFLSQTGCVVPQKPGRGDCLFQVEPTTGRGYYLYLPDDYMKHQGQRSDNARWPVVVTFHGMDPWDTAARQAKECQAEADRYGFIVIAPKLDTSSSFMQYPLKDPNLSYVKRDERAVIAIMDEVFRRTNADPTRVLSTSWSCGGYLAHYMVNRYPERFSCLAVRQSNFSEDLLSEAQVPKYRHVPIGIYFGENDLPACRHESVRAVEWYRERNFRVEAKLVEGLAHERTPQTAAAFFAATMGVRPKTPPPLGKMVMKDVVPEGGRFRTVNGGMGGLSSRQTGDRNMVFSSPQPAKGAVRVSPSAPVRRAMPTLPDEGSSPTPRRLMVPFDPDAGWPPPTGG